MRYLRYVAYGVAGFLLLALLGAIRFSHISASYDPTEPLPLYDKVIVYSGHAVMVAGGFVTRHTAVAQEAYYLHIPGLERRRWHSDFPSHSPLVQKHTAALKREILNGASSASSRVAWSNYTPENQEYGLALNSLLVTATRSENGIRYQGVVECSYPEDALITLRTGIGINIHLNEGLYRALEKAGWLHPYKAVWVWEEAV